MKRILLAIIACVLIGVCNAQESYKMTGSVENVPTGMIYIVKPKGQGIDTLIRTNIKNGRFELQGKVESPTIAAVCVEGQRGLVLFFLENANYTANIDLTKKYASKIEGGSEQAVYNQYAEIQRRAADRIEKIQQEMSQATTLAERDSIRKSFTKLNLKQQAEETQLIRENPDACVYGLIIAETMQIFFLDLVKERYELLSEKGKATEWGKRVGECVGLRERTDIGRTAPDFPLLDVGGKKFNMSEVKGKVKVLVFGSVSEGTSRQANTSIEKLYKEFHDKGLEVICVSLDEDKENGLKVIEEETLTCKLGMAEQPAVVKYLYGIKRIPSTYVLDKNNRILGKQLGEYNLKNLVIKSLE